MSTRVAVVTGANKGLGFGIVRELCKQFDGDVILAARDEGRGKAAVQELEKESLKPKFHQLDVTSPDSIIRLKDFLQQNYGGLDVLVNNAGIAFFESDLPMAEQAAEAVKVNYLGVLETSGILFPLLRPHARVCNMSSMASSFAIKACSEEVRARLTNPNITMEELTQMMTHFVQAAQENKLLEEGFPENAYGFSKVGVTIMSTLQQQELDRQGTEDIVVNACSPGFVKTDMTKGKGNITVEEGIITPLYCALLPPNITSPRGLLIRDKAPVDWFSWSPSS